MNKYVAISDSVRKIENQSKGSLIESIYSTKKEVIKTKNNQWYIVGFMFLGLMIGLILIIQLRKLNILEIQKTEIHYQQQKNRIRIDVLTKHSESLLKKIETVKSNQSSERKKASPAVKEKLDRKIYEDILHLNDIDFFYTEMDTVLNNLVSKLRSRYPALTSKEICWCCLYLLHIPTTDIYLLLDYKVGSLKKMKQRLAQKIILSGIKGIDDFLIGILTE
jgi:hypothetical protein